jgi:hypothetical protein
MPNYSHFPVRPEVYASRFNIHRRFQMKMFFSFALTTGALIAAGALIIATSNVVAESGGAPATGTLSPALGRDNSAAVDLTGTWQVSWTAKNGEQRQLPMQITQKGSQLSGSVDWGQRTPSPVKGTLDGNQVSLTTKLRRRIKLTGTVDGNKMSGTTSRGVAWSATRQ